MMKRKFSNKPDSCVEPPALRHHPSPLICKWRREGVQIARALRGNPLRFRLLRNGEGWWRSPLGRGKGDWLHRSYPDS